MKNVLIFQDLWDIVSDESNPTEDEANWNIKDKKSLAAIILSFKLMQLQYIKGCEKQNQPG